MTQEEALKVDLPRFVAEMETKIRDSTGQYGDFTLQIFSDLVEGLRRELRELDRELKGTEVVDNRKCESCGHREFKYRVTHGLVAGEALDVANLAFMVWWGAIKLQRQREEEDART